MFHLLNIVLILIIKNDETIKSEMPLIPTDEQIKRFKKEFKIP